MKSKRTPLKIRTYFKQDGSYLKCGWYSSTYFKGVSVKEISGLMHEHNGLEVSFEKDSHNNGRMGKYEILRNLIHQLDVNAVGPGDKKFLNRVILNGGLVEYAKRLEGQK